MSSGQGPVGGTGWLSQTTLPTLTSVVESMWKPTQRPTDTDARLPVSMINETRFKGFGATEGRSCRSGVCVFVCVWCVFLYRLSGTDHGTFLGHLKGKGDETSCL